MRKFIGHIKCPKCGFTHIVDPRQIVIYYNFDASEQMAEVVCFGCRQVVEGKIDDQDVFAFGSKGVRLIPWHHKLPPLTEREIDEWDIEEELNEVVY